MTTHTSSFTERYADDLARLDQEEARLARIQARLETVRNPIAHLAIKGAEAIVKHDVRATTERLDLAAELETAMMLKGGVQALGPEHI